MFKKTVVGLGAFLATCVLVACGSPSGEGSASHGVPKTQDISVEAVVKDTQGFVVGPVTAAREAYVFFDAQCQHCARLWADSKLLPSGVKLTWIPVGILRPSSVAQGASLLSVPASEAAARMDEHERLLSSGQGGISSSVPTPQMRAVIERNTAVLSSFGAGGVPFIVGKHQDTGKVVTISGAVPSAVLAMQLGWGAP